MKKFKNDSLIICDNQIKNKILKDAFENKVIQNYTFISITDFINKYYFKITTEAYLYAADFLGISYENSKIITPNIYYIDLNTSYDDRKLSQLQSLKRNLLAANLLEVDELFSHFLNRKKLYVYDLDLDCFSQKMFDEISSFVEVEYFNLAHNYKLNELYEYEDYQQEVEQTFVKIRTLLDRGIDINKIYIVCNDPSYYHLINRYASLFAIDVLIKDSTKLIANFEVKKVILALENNTPYQKIVDNIYNETIKKQIINVFNQYQKYPKEVILTEIKKLTYDTDNYRNVVRVVDLEFQFADDEYAFILAFSDGNIPNIYLDIDYLPDKYADILPITTSEEKNKNARNKAISLLSSINNKTLSYAKKTTEDKSVSSLVRHLNLTIIKENVNQTFSSKLANLTYGELMDNYLKYQEQSEELKLLHNSLDVNYKGYDNQYKQVDCNRLFAKLDGKISLSYSSVSTYFKCGFYYYLKHILKVPETADKRAADLGVAYHGILEHYHQSGFDLEKEKAFWEEKFQSEIERFYFHKLWDDFLTVLAFIDASSEYTLLQREKHENEIIIPFDKTKYQRNFKGFIDKIIYEQIDGVDYLAIVDYKTGNQSSSLDNIVYGFNLQLPIYAYLIMRSDLFDNPKLLGTYLQYVFADLSLSKTKSVEIARWDSLKLDGYTINDQNLLRLLDCNFKDSKMIKNLKVKSSDNQFHSNAKVLSGDNFACIVDLVENLLKKAFTEIESGNFSINPKYINQKNQSCTFCHYQDICHLKYQDKVDLKEKKITEILGGE